MQACIASERLRIEKNAQLSLPQSCLFQEGVRGNASDDEVKDEFDLDNTPSETICLREENGVLVIEDDGGVFQLVVVFVSIARR